MLVKKKSLRNRRERIVEDLTWKKRKMRWKLEDMRKGRKKEETRWIGYEKKE